MQDYSRYFDSCVFAYDGARSVLHDKDLGICADVSSLRTPPTSPFALQSMQGCPYTNSALDIDLWLCGEPMRCSAWQWLPNAIARRGASDTLEVETLTAVACGMRSAVERITLTNRTERALCVPYAIRFRGATRYEDYWEFYYPALEEGDRRDYSFADGVLSHVANGAAYRLTTTLPDPVPFIRAYLLEGSLTLAAGESRTFYLSVHMGAEAQSEQEAHTVRADYEATIAASFAYLEREVARIEAQLPHFSCDTPALEALYYRSLVTYILCRWENPDLCAIPYYSTGSVTGACMCSYLWDYCGGLMMHPVYDPEGNKKQLRAYLRNDLTKSYALNPVTSRGVGPWYPINQEKIILMVYHHVLATGEISFLSEEIEGRTVLDWMRHYAYVCDDLTKEVALYDYGKKGNSHLELRPPDNGHYNGIMPDLNARRYLNYTHVYELTQAAGQPDTRLLERASALKEALKALWNKEEQWYDFIDADGKRDIRYTVQMFKFLNSPVIDRAEREGLISHLNEREFLSPFGLHSLSKTDPMYHQDDIDNGGGGSCTHFVVQICAQLYEMGYDTIATDILRRIYWWGERLPYLGDSCAANFIENREDTPLQGDISSVSCAQMMFFYLCGIQAHFDGSVTVCPVKNRPCQEMKMENARLCGKIFSLSVTNDTFTVTCDGITYSAAVGETVTLK